jgi:hypothetical protein
MSTLIALNHMLTSPAPPGRSRIDALSGDRREQVSIKSGEDLQGRRIERGSGHLHRCFVLPDSVDGEKVNSTGRPVC